MFNTLKEIGQKFRLPGEIYSYDAITMGNINSTYKVTYMPSAEVEGFLITAQGIYFGSIL